MSIGMNQAKVTQELGVSLLRKVLDTAEVEVMEIAKLLESSSAIELAVSPHLGSSIDIQA
ncbi:MAG: YjfB family protein [Tissierella sp.]|uniref:YjfB family protein n=1 Tax=Tissierella sp. TaxID=41274 RepID=UPI003F9E4417